MNIALVSQEYPPETAKGGIGSQTCIKARGLTSLGHKVYVISRSTDGRRHEYLDGPVNVVRIPGMENSMGVYTEVTDWVTYSAEVAKALFILNKDIRFDVVDFPEWAAEGFVHLSNQSEWNRLPSVIQLHGPLVMFGHALKWPDLDSDFFKIGTFLESTCLRLATAVYSSSHCSKDWCVRHYGLDGEKIPVIHAGIDTNRFAPQALPKLERPTIISVGKLVPNKGFHTLVAAACRVAGKIPELRLRLIGTGTEEEKQKLLKIAVDNGFPDLVELVGFVDHDSLPLKLSKAHVFASASEYEGGPGFVAIEAMSCGLPVVVCAGSGADEEVLEGKTGITVEPRNVDELAEALAKILFDESKRGMMAECARNHAVEKCDSRGCIKRIETFYLETIEDFRDKHLKDGLND